MASKKAKLFGKGSDTPRVITEQSDQVDLKAIKKDRIMDLIEERYDPPQMLVNMNQVREKIKSIDAQVKKDTPARVV